jgi:hypothetical protein
MHQLREGLPPLPDRMKPLPIDERGYPVPRFVEWIDGKPDFRVMDRDFVVQAFRTRKCWLCGETMGKYMVFVVGPMCTVNRTSAEPPCHLDCAIFAAKACPFMVRPMAKRRDANIPDSTIEPAGMMIRRNPGVTCLWTVKEYTPFRAGRGILFQMGEPTEVRWYCEGRRATREDVLASLDSGLPLLEAEAAKGGPGDKKALERAHKTALRYIPQ